MPDIFYEGSEPSQDPLWICFMPQFSGVVEEVATSSSPAREGQSISVLESAENALPNLRVGDRVMGVTRTFVNQFTGLNLDQRTPKAIQADIRG
eukprot:scaffold161039_cov32-Prasinocladus_malaysianus.AAC.1